jgi:rhodanese-related sulfurtransferase
MHFVRFFGLNNPLQVKYSKEPGNLGRPPRPSPGSLIRMNESTKIATQIGALLILSASVAFISNAARENRLPLVMPFPPAYQCASLEKPGVPIDPYMALKLYGKPGTVFIDARKEGAFRQGHIEGARTIPYSFVEPLSKEIVDGLKDYTRVIVYDSGKDSEASSLMAGELAQAGVKGAVYLEKGFMGWVKAGGLYTGKTPEGYDE